MMDLIEQLRSSGQLPRKAELALRRARARTHAEIYALVTHFPYLEDVDTTALSAYALTGLDAATVADIEFGEKALLPASQALGALPPDNSSLDKDTRALDGLNSLAGAGPLGGTGTSLVAGKNVDLRPNWTWPVRDQWRRGTCVAHAVVSLAEHLRAADPMPDFSEQFLFAHAKVLDHAPGSDGTWIDFARQVLAAPGVCDEAFLRYNPTPVRVDIGHVSSLPPPPPAPPIAIAHTAPVYQRLPVPPPPGVATSIHGLLSNGRPVAISVPVFYDPVKVDSNNWNVRSAQEWGEVLDPLKGMSAKGGHAVCITGYVQDPSAAGGGWFILRNSWGVAWGRLAGTNPGRPSPAPGYGAISADYVERFTWEYCQL